MGVNWKMVRRALVGRELMLFGLLVVGIVLISGCVQEEGLGEEEVPQEGEEEEGAESQDLDKTVEMQYKGVWMPTLLFQDQNYLSSNIQKLKGIGINTVFIQTSPPQPELWLEKAKEVLPPELIERINETLPSEKELIIDIIQTAHRNGLKVGLTISSPPGMERVDLDALNSKVVEYAQLAEEYDVELFAPMNEPGKILLENTGKWRQEILPKIKEVYHGEIVWKGCGPGLPDKTLSEEFLREISEGPPGDFVGYDYIGFSSMFIPSEVMAPEERLQYADQLTLEGYSQYVEGALDYELALAERDNCKGVIITEFGVLEKGSLSEEEIARAHEIVLEKGAGKVFGFIVLDFLEVELPGIPLVEEDLKIEEVIRRWYQEELYSELE